MEGSVLTRTSKDYKKHHAVFNNFRETLQESDDPGEFFEYCQNDIQRTQEVVLFIKYLYSVRGYRGSSITATLCGLGYCLELLGVDSKFLHTKSSRRAIRACGRSPDEVREHHAQRIHRDKDPATGTILQHVRSLYWEGRGWDTKADMDARGSWLAVALGFDSGSRIGNVTRKDGKDGADHCIRTTDVAIELERYPGDRLILKGSRLLKLEIASGSLDPKKVVTRAWLTLISSKTSKTSKNQLEPKLLERRTQAESQLLDDLIEWMMKSGTLDDDELLTRYHGELRRSTTRKDATTALKAGAESAGKDPQKYSSKSLRGGLATLARQTNMPDDELNTRGGWAIGSKVPRQFYTSSGKGGRGGMAMLNGDDMTSLPRSYYDDETDLGAPKRKRS